MTVWETWLDFYARWSSERETLKEDHQEEEEE